MASTAAARGVLRITLDAAYPWIVISVCDAIEDVRGRRPSAAEHARERCVTITSYWKSWACLFLSTEPVASTTGVSR